MSCKGDTLQPARISARMRALYHQEGDLVYESRSFALRVARDRRRNRAAAQSRRRNRV